MADEDKSGSCIDPRNEDGRSMAARRFRRQGNPHVMPQQAGVNDSGALTGIEYLFCFRPKRELPAAAGQWAVTGSSRLGSTLAHGRPIPPRQKDFSPRVWQRQTHAATSVSRM